MKNNYQNTDQQLNLTFIDLPKTDLFQGSDIKKEYDNIRLTGQLKTIFTLMKTGAWYTLSELQNRTGYLASSVSAQLRNLRKPQFGSHRIEKRTRGDRTLGLFEYRLIPNPQLKIDET